MIFEYIKFKNFRPYYGEQILYFRKKNNKKESIPKRNIILIGGLNGHGKTSLINSINICLFRHLIFNNKNLYYDYLKESVNNKHKNEGGNHASIELAFTDQGTTYASKVTFDTQGYENSALYVLDENFNKVRNVNINEQAYIEFIEQRIPLDVSQFFIFDAERIRDLVGEQNSVETREAIQKIMSLDIYKKLSDDLNFIYNRTIREIKSYNLTDNQKELIEKQEKNISKLEKLQKQEQELSLELVNLQTKLKKLKNERIRIHSINSESKGNLMKRIGSTDEKLEFVNKNLMNSKDELSQIILRPHIRKLKNDIRAERNLIKKREITLNKLTPYNQFIDKLLNITIQPPLVDKQKIQLKQEGEKIWTKLNKINTTQLEKNFVPIHYVSDREYSSIINYPEKISSDVKKYLDQKQELELLLEKLNNKLKNAPNKIDDSKIIHEIEKINMKIGETNNQLRNINHNINELKNIRRDLRREYEKIEERKERILPLQKRNKMISSLLDALDEFLEEVTVLKAHDLKLEVEAIIKLLFRKDEFNKVYFNDQTFELSIYNRFNEKMNLDVRSEGEKQLIALTMIWALTKVSGIEFPFVIDTPLARLDSVHRSNLVNYYFTKLSKQVIILSTDTEITYDFYNELKPFIELSYTLEYDEENDKTIVKEGYFFDDKEENSWQL